MKSFTLLYPYNDLPAGTILYPLQFHDYGLARDDTNSTGIEHKSMTLKEDGGYPSFTIPVHMVRQNT